MIIALEVDLADRSLRAFFHGIYYARSAAAFVNWFDLEFDRNVSEPLALIVIDDFLPRLLEIILVHRRVQFYADVFAEFLRADFVRSIDRSEEHTSALQS